MDALEEVAGRRDLSVADVIADGLELEDEFLEPELVDLVNDDEKELVVSRRVGQQVLRGEDLGNLEVTAVGELAILFTEARRTPAGAQLSPSESPESSVSLVVSSSTTLVDVYIGSYEPNSIEMIGVPTSTRS